MTAPKRPRRLTNLVIREISSVEAGAGEGATVKILKRDDDGELPDPIAKGIGALRMSLNSILAADDELIDKQSAIDETLGQFHDYLQELAPDGLSPSPAEKGQTDMTDIIDVAKRMAATGLPSCSYSRADFLVALNNMASDERRDGETTAQSFTRLVTSDPDGVALYRAHRASPGNDCPDRAERPVAKVVEPAPSASLTALRKIAAELCNREPSLTRDQAFAKVYSDPRNRELVRSERSENRPGAEITKADRSTVVDRVAALAASLASQHRDMSHDDAIKAVLARNPALTDAYRQECGQAA